MPSTRHRKESIHEILPRTATGLALLLLGAGTAFAAGSIDGRYDATLNLKGTIIPFRLDITSQGNSVTGTLYNGEDKQTTTDASIANGVVTLNFEHYLTKIVATSKDGKLEGKLLGRFERETYISEEPFTAVPHVDQPLFQGSVPGIDGVWEIEYDSQKGEKAWRFIVKQNGAAVSASILRIDGDTGALVGSYKDGKFVLSHFDGSRPLVAEVTPEADGTLQLQLKGAYTPDKPLIAYRPEAARAKGLPHGSTGAGGYIGAQSTTTTQPNYITALVAGTYTSNQWCRLLLCIN